MQNKLVKVYLPLKYTYGKAPKAFHLQNEKLEGLAITIEEIETKLAEINAQVVKLRKIYRWKYNFGIPILMLITGTIVSLTLVLILEFGKLNIAIPTIIIYAVLVILVLIPIIVMTISCFTFKRSLMKANLEFLHKISYALQEYRRESKIKGVHWSIEKNADNATWLNPFPRTDYVAFL